jgi:hypothetical protein
MTSAGSAFQNDNGRKLLEPEDRQHFQNEFEKQAVRSYFFLSFGIGLIASLLPVVLVLIGGYRGNYSISWFYHVVPGPTRDILVGALWATGVFLILFHGLSRLENWLLNFAGIAVISVAMNPMPDEQRCGGSGLTPHSLSAILFFALLAIVAVFLSKGRIKFIKDKRKRLQFAAAYNLAGFLMIAMPAAVAAIHYLGGNKCGTHAIFWTETFGIWTFAAYWFVKTYEYRLLLRIKLTSSE